jgi:CheY-like chemotaxis protein
VSDAASYDVTCHKCQASFDALLADWCHCLATERSVACPSCGSCFCKAPAGYVQKFWSGAPQEMRERKQKEKTQPFSVPNLPLPDELKRPLVLLVDDETIIQRVATRAIEALGYGVLVAKNGEEGLALARAYKPDLVLTDALMPRLDGREMARQIKEDAETAHVKVVLMTALYTSVKHEHEAYKAFKVDDYVTKPLDLERLRAVLQKHLGVATQASS